MKAPATTLRLPPAELPQEAREVRARVRRLLREEREKGTWEPADPRSRSWGGYNPALSRSLGAAGFIGMTWPGKYGGGERSFLERYVLTEELLAAGAPTGFHWVADRQSGPLLLRFGTEEQKERFLPPITRGETSFCIGMSEPDSGSDLASIRTRAEKVDGGWRLSGSKIWTSNAHRAHYIIVLCRTEAPSENRHAGMSQLLVDLNSAGLTTRPILNLVGSHDFNEVRFDQVFVPDDHLLGKAGGGWEQVTSELAYERSGPERFLTNLRLLRDLVRLLSRDASAEATREVGRLVTHLKALRGASLSVASLLQAGHLPNVESALVKDLGTHFQQELPEVVRRVASLEGVGDGELVAVLERAIMAAPAYTIQGGTTEILRGIVARGLRLR